MNKKYILPAITILAAGAMLFGATTTYANTYDAQTFVQKLAVKLGVSEDKVQNAVDDLRTERQSEMQKKLEEKLSQAVKDGKITESQKSAILAKHKEMQAKHISNRDVFKDMTAEERRSAMQKERDELKIWAEEQNIDLKEFLGIKGKWGMGWKMKMMH